VAEYQITYWREIPSMVVARDDSDTFKVALANRFQEAIDEAAMRLGASDADAYMNGWNRSDWTQADGSVSEIAERISRELEENLNEEQLNELLDSLNTED
jgi:hypothetical protein